MATSGTVGSLSGQYKTTYTVDWELLSQSIENNTSTIRLTSTLYTGNSTTIASDYSNFVTDGTTMYSGAYSKSGAGNVFVRTKDIVVTHNNDGSFPGRSVSFSTNDYIMGNQSDSGNITGVDPIPRQAELLTAPNFNDLDNPEITYYNPAGSSVTGLQACIASANGQTIYVPYRNVSPYQYGTYIFNLTEAERNTLRQACSGDSMDVRFYLKTVIGNETLWSFLQRTFSIVNGNYVNINGTFKKAIPYVNINGTWKRALPYVNVNNTWKKGRY